MGLGLFIVKVIVEVYYGILSVYFILGKGL